MQNGYNTQCIYTDSVIATLKRMLAEGHQVASHTWSHPDLLTLSQADVATQMTKLEDAMLKTIGVVPAYMRPPFGNHNAAIDATIGGLGYGAWPLNWQRRRSGPSGIETAVTLACPLRHPRSPCHLGP